METIKFKDIAHLHIGCNYMLSNDAEKEVYVLRPEYIGEHGFVSVIKPILRRLPSMSDEEALQIYDRMKMGDQTMSDSAKITQTRELLKRRFNQQTNLPGDKWIQLVPYLLSHGFDLFGLIESGEAIEQP